MRFGRGVGEAPIENTAFDRPRSWSAVSTSRRLDVRFRGQVTQTQDGCELAVHNELAPRRVLHLLAPLRSGVLRRSWERDLRDQDHHRAAGTAGQDRAVRTMEAVSRVFVPGLCCPWGRNRGGPMNIGLIGVFDP